MAQQQIIDIVKKYLAVLEDEGIHVDEAYLYGSHAKNEATEESDIDVLLVSSAFDNRDDFTAGKVWALTRKVNSLIEPYMMGRKQFNAEETSPLVQIVKQEGIGVS